ncbi:hypothetical protein [Pseudomonas protegens]|nr:hypothetical protein [Pseudomonas protegens]
MAVQSEGAMVYAKVPVNNPLQALGRFSAVLCVLNAQAPGQ